MDEHPARALVRKKRSSIVVATGLVKAGEADAVVTAGHTGAGMAAGKLILGTLPGIERPALAVQMISAGRPFVLLDIGANPDSTAENLAQFARMGAIFSERVLGVDRPRVALLSIGEEKGKGDARIQRATELLDETDLNFVGNVEGKDLTRQMADVVVCDAVLGNVVIKFFEGLSGFIFDLFRAEFSGSIRGRLAYLLMRPSIRRIRGVFDYEVVGGSPLLGVRGRGDHHPRPRPPAHDRARRPRRGGDRPGARAGADRRGARRRPARRVRRRGRAGDDLGGHPVTPVLSVGPGRDPRDGAPGRARGAGRAARRVAAGRAGATSLGGSPIRIRIREGRVDVTVRLVARPRQPLVPLTAEVRQAVGAAVERLLGMELGAVTVLVDGVGA